MGARGSVAALLAASVLAGGLGLYAWRGTKEAGKPKPGPGASEERLFAAPGKGQAAPALTRITVTARGGTTTLERGDSGWRLTAPVSAPADRRAVEALLTQLQSARLRATVEENPTEADLARYGLSPPAFTVTASGDDGAASVTLHGGIENPFDGSVYVRREGDPRVHTAEGSVRLALDKGPFELRDKEVLALDPASVRSIEVKTRAHAWTLERGDDKAWRLMKPSARLADEARVKELLSSLKSQRALAFPPDSAAERTRMGLDAPMAEARFTLVTGEPVRLRLAVRDGEAHAYALREQGSDATLTEVPAGALTALDVAPGELRDRKVLNFKREDVRRVVFQPDEGGAPFSVTRLKGSGVVDDWEVDAPSRARAQKWKLVAVLGGLSALKASAFVEAPSKRGEKYGLTASSRGVTLLGADGQVLARLSLGQEVPNEPGRLYAQGSGDEVMEVESSRLNDLPEALADLLEPAPSDAGTASETP
ncbi:DUF4340 domain-containing protein [Myxococcaceae bacterium GXIMD 01537]